MAKELTNQQIEDYYNQILERKITLKKAAKKEGISSDYLKKLINEHLNSEDEKESFQQRLYNNKYKNTYINETPNLIYNIKEYLINKKTIKEASKDCNMNEETFKSKVFEELEKNSELLKKYISNGNNKNDYSQVNTKLIIINMLKNDMSQSEMANSLGMPIRTLSGWVNKLPEDDNLKKWAKDSVYRTMRGLKLSEEAREQLKKQLDDYIEENGIRSTQIDTRSIDERELEKTIEFLKKVYELENQLDEKGKKKYTRKRITEMLHVGNAAIRRAENKKRRLELVIESKNKEGVEK